MNIFAPKITKKLLLASSFAVLASCGGKYAGYDTQTDPIDRASNLTSQDYVKQLFPKPPAEGVTVETKTPPLPKVADIILMPEKPRTGINKTVSISVTEDVPLKDVFIELARLADVDIEVDSKITGGIIFKAKNKPFDEVIQRITDMAGLRYSVNGGVIRIEADSEYVENYSANFLNQIRSSESQIGVSNKLSSGDSGSGGGGGGGSGGSGDSGGSGGGGSGGGSSGSGGSSGENGSKTSISAKSGGDGDIWNSIQSEIGAIIGNSSAVGAATDKGNTSVSGAGVATAGATDSVSGDSMRFVSLNREAGVVSVKTTGKNHAKVKEYLTKVKEYYSTQVLIEAKVLEVGLKDEFRSGVDWSVISKKNGNLKNGIVNVTLPSDGFPATDFARGANLALLNFASGDLKVAAELAQVFGTTKTLASPRILAMNNQQALLTFTKNVNYFSLTCSVTPAVVTDAGITAATLSSSSQLHTIPVGVILNMQPAIDAKNNEVVLNVRPTLSRLTGVLTSDPNAKLCAASAAGNNFGQDFIDQIESLVPQVEVREMDSTLRLKSGEVMAIGGMIDQKNNNSDAGIPLLSDIPILGNAFKTVDKDNQTVQTVIFLKATIVPAYGVDEDDQHLYNKFNNDPRPLKF